MRRRTALKRAANAAVAGVQVHPVIVDLIERLQAPARVIEYPVGSKRAERATLIGKAARMQSQGRLREAERALTEADALLPACVEEADKKKGGRA